MAVRCGHTVCWERAISAGDGRPVECIATAPRESDCPKHGDEAISPETGLCLRCKALADYDAPPLVPCRRCQFSDELNEDGFCLLCSQNDGAAA